VLGYGSMTGTPGGEADAFFGRERDLEALAALVDAGARLVTLHGAAGIGKTRLARRFAAAHAARHGWATLTCALGGAREARDLEPDVALALGVSVREASDVAVSIADALRDRGPTLVVLDECDRVVQRLGALLSRLLTLAPDVRWLATSRELLRVRGEHAHEVGPLPVETDAVALFVDRARSLQPGWEPDDAVALVEVARRLEGIPLAIELAAARTRVLDLRGLLGRLARSAPLEGAIAGSWDLLEPSERRALAQLSVFRGGFALDGAEVVLDVDRAPVDAVEALLDKSLVRPVQHEELVGTKRFGLYESIRSFAADRLRELGEEAPTLERHARHYLGLAAGWDPAAWHGGVESPQQLGVERENLLAVHERARAAGSLDALRAAIALFPIYWMRGPFGAFLDLLDPASDELLLARAAPELRARYLLVRGRARQLVARRDESLQDYRAALVAARQVGERRLVASALVHVGTAERLAGQLEEARDRYEAALRLFEEEGDERSAGVVLSVLGAIDLVTGHLDAARTLLLRAIDALARVGDQNTRAMVLVDMGLVEQERGDLEAAEGAFDESARVHGELGNRRHLAITAGYRAGLDREAGRLRDARVRYAEALETAVSVGDVKLRALWGAGLAAVLAELGELDAAESHLAEAERHAHAQGEPRVVATVALHRARLELARGHEESAEERRAMAVGLAAQSDDVRFALRMLVRAGGAAADRPSRARSGEALVIGENADFFVRASA
jgi:predicted ATPase